MEASRALSCLGNRVLPRPGRARPAYKNEPDALRHVKSVLFGGVANEPARPLAGCRRQAVGRQKHMTGSCCDLPDPTPRKLDAPPAPVKRIIRKFRKAPRGLAECCKRAAPQRLSFAALDRVPALPGKRYPQARAPGFRHKSLHGAGFLPAGEKTLASSSRSLYTPVSQRSAFGAFRFGILLQQAVGQPIRKPGRPEQPKRLVGV